MTLFKVSILIILCIILLAPTLVLADRGMVVWPPEVYLDETAQNAILAWSGNEEIIILSTNVESPTTATCLEILPLPSNPTEVKEGSFESFEKLVEIMNEKLEEIRTEFRNLGKGTEAPTAGIEITFHEIIGAHDVTVVKVNDLDYFLAWVENFAKDKDLGEKVISPEFKKGIANYLQRGINYFVFDVIEITKEKESIKPLIYRFNSDFLYYPLKITAVSDISQSQAEIHIFFVTEKEVPDTFFTFQNLGGWFSIGYPVELTKDELKEVSLDISNLFEDKVTVKKVSFFGRLSDLRKDIVLYPSWFWQNNLRIGDRGEEVRVLQKILINEEVWNSEVEATGYFGSITKRAVIEFQEKYSSEILEPLGLTKGTGFVGPFTRAFLNKYKIEFEDFCGWSTYGKCNSDEDCKKGGCSGQVCESKFDESTITTCEWRDCYSAKKYTFSCKCVEGKCQWAKKINLLLYPSLRLGWAKKINLLLSPSLRLGRSK